MPSTSNVLHMSYHAPDADLTLVASNGQEFRVHSSIMSLSSGFFKDMLTIASLQSPQDRTSGSSKSEQLTMDTKPAASREAEKHTERIGMTEDGCVLKHVLDIAYPGKVYFEKKEPLFSVFKHVCYAAEKYDMPGVLRTLQLYFHSVTTSYPPLELYALASHFGWSTEANLVLPKILRLDLSSKDCKELLVTIPSAALVDLFDFLRMRRNRMMTMLDLDDTVGSKALSIRRQEFYVGFCGNVEAHFYPYWTAFKYCVQEEMERAPDGSFLKNAAFWKRKEFESMFREGCKCKARLMKDRIEFELLRAFSRMPQAI